MRHVASFRYAYRKRRPPHQRLRLLLVSWPPGHNGDGFDRESERRRRRARHLPRRGSLRLSLRHESRSSRRRRLQGPVRRAHPRRWRRAPARSDLRGLKGAAGELIISGNTGRVVKADQGCLAYAGLAPDLFASDGAGFGAFRKALWSENWFAPEAFQNRQNFFGGKNVTAIVLEVPSSMIGRGVVHAWATASLYGHAPEVQVSRWGLPMITHLLLSAPSLHDASAHYHRAVPADEVALFSKPIRDFVEKVTALAHSAADPSAYATQLLARLCPGVLPYELDTPAAFTFAAFNGRGLWDDVMDVILTLATNTALGDGVAPDKRLMRPDFPYFGEPHVTAASSAKQ